MATEQVPSALWSQRMQLSGRAEERLSQKHASFKGQVREEESGSDRADSDQGQRTRTTQWPRSLRAVLSRRKCHQHLSAGSKWGQHRRMCRVG